MAQALNLLILLQPVPFMKFEIDLQQQLELIGLYLVQIQKLSLVTEPMLSTSPFPLE